MINIIVTIEKAKNGFIATISGDHNREFVENKYIFNGVYEVYNKLLEVYEPKDSDIPF